MDKDDKHSIIAVAIIFATFLTLRILVELGIINTDLLDPPKQEYKYLTCDNQLYVDEEIEYEYRNSFHWDGLYHLELKNGETVKVSPLNCSIKKIWK